MVNIYRKVSEIVYNPLKLERIILFPSSNLKEISDLYMTQQYKNDIDKKRNKQRNASRSMALNTVYDRSQRMVTHVESPSN